jgi:protein-tyrosine phosphatase
VSLDLLIPFGILLVLVVYLISSRTKFEKQTIKEYEEKFENWKVHAKPQEKEVQETKRELVGLVFKKNGKIEIELFDEFTNDRIQKGKFNSKIRE